MPSQSFGKKSVAVDSDKNKPTLLTLGQHAQTYSFTFVSFAAVDIGFRGNLVEVFRSGLDADTGWSGTNIFSSNLPQKHRKSPCRKQTILSTIGFYVPSPCIAVDAG